MKADAPALLSHIQENSPTLISNHLHRQGNLLAAVTAEAAEDIAGKALAVDSNQHRLFGGYVSHDQSQMFVRVGITLVGDNGKLAILVRQLRLSHPMHQFLVTTTVGNKVGDTHNLNPELLRHGLKLRQARHGAIFIHDLTDDPGGVEASQPGQVNDRLSMARPHQNTTVPGTQGEHMTGAD